MSLYCFTACSLPFCSQWSACPFNTYLSLHISSFNYWLTERQYWALHYKNGRLTGHQTTVCLPRTAYVTTGQSRWIFQTEVTDPSQVTVRRVRDLGHIAYWSAVIYVNVPPAMSLKENKWNEYMTWVFTAFKKLRKFIFLNVKANLRIGPNIQWPIKIHQKVKTTHI